MLDQTPQPVESSSAGSAGSGARRDLVLVGDEALDLRIG
jgi:hypothetical protein